MAGKCGRGRVMSVRWLPGGAGRSGDGGAGDGGRSGGTGGAGDVESADWRVRRAANRVVTGFSATPLVGRALERAVRAYRYAVRAALPVEPAVAWSLVRRYDGQVPDDRYPFGERDAGWLDGQFRDDLAALAVVYEVAGRAGLAGPRRRARDRIADLAGRSGDADALVSWFVRWQDGDLLDAETLARALRAHLTRTTLERDRALWLAFFDRLPERLLPAEFEV